MTLNLATLIERVTRRDAAAAKPAEASVDPFDRLARIVRVERAREDAILRLQMERSAV